MKKRNVARNHVKSRISLRLPAGAMGRSGMRLALIVLLLITLSVLVNFGEQVVRSANMENQRIELQAEVAQLKAANVQLKGAAEFAESDVSVEQQARELLAYAREGDKVILPQLPPPQPTATPPPPAIT